MKTSYPRRKGITPQSSSKNFKNMLKVCENTELTMSGHEFGIPGDSVKVVLNWFNLVSSLGNGVIVFNPQPTRRMAGMTGDV